MSETCIINYASGWFVRGQNRLRQACLDVGYQGDFLLFNDENPLRCPPHPQVPYAFKPYAMKEAQKRGYRLILWCDASVFPVCSMEPAFKIIDDTGYLFFMCGWKAGEWCSDAALEALGVTREEALQMNQLVGGCQGLNLANPLSREYLDRLYHHASDGISFIGDWQNDKGQVSKDKRVLGHRHDQAVGSIIAWQLGMREFRPNMLVYDERGDKPRHPETIFLVRSA